MLQKFVSETGKGWLQWVPFLLFVIREVPQASIGYSPFQLLYGRQLSEALDILREKWETPSHTEQAPTSYLEVL